MTSAQQKAVKKYRNRQKSQGFTRMELSIPAQDREILRAIAANLRAGGTVAENTRNVLETAMNPYIGMNFKEFLEAAPIEGLEFERQTDPPRDVDL